MHGSNCFKKLIIITLFLLLAFPAINALPQERPFVWEVYFSPGGGAVYAIVRELNNAKISVRVQACWMTSAMIARALMDAHERGIKVDVILDKNQRKDKNSQATFLSNAGIQVKIDSQHHIAHNKIIVIDEETVITGSYNFTKAAEENNAENLLVIHDKDLAKHYIKNWHDHAQHSKPYEGLIK